MHDKKNYYIYNSIITIIYTKNMGHKVKIQRVERGKTKSFYINFPAAIAEAGQFQKGEEMEWFIEDRNTYVLKKVIESKSLIKKD